MARRLQTARGTAAIGITVNQMSASELIQELTRRAEKLQSEREKLLERIATIDEELAALSVAPRGGGSRTKRKTKGKGGGRSAGRTPTGRSKRSRPVNDRPLAEYIVDALGAGPMKVAEISAAVLEAGYRTTSQRFANTVSVTLGKDDRFARAGEGRWKVV